MAQRLNDRQFAELESSILSARNRADRLLLKYAQMRGIDTEDYFNGGGEADEIFDALNAASASFKQAYELLV